MTQKSQNKFTAFKPATLRDWEVAAREELKGADPWEKLRHNVQGCAILPIYAPAKDIPPSPLLDIPEKSFLGPRTWYNCPRVVVENAKKSNEKALEHLRNGADGIFFELGDEKDFKTLLKDIDSRYCSLNFLAKNNSQAQTEALQHFFDEINYSHDQIPGAFFGNNTISNPIKSEYRFLGFESKAHPSLADEIASCFEPLTGIPDADFQVAANQVAFSVTLSTDFFLSIAKLRVLRIVWHRFLSAKKITENSSLFIHAYSLPWTAENYQPHGNMLTSTTAALAAILGGCDALTLEPEDANNTMMSRVACNVSNILREESFLSKVADPMAGSHFIETISRQIADEAWNSIALRLKA